MKRILLSGLLLLPLLGICQQSNDAIAGYYDLKQEDVLAFLSKDSVDKSEVLRDLNVFDLIGGQSFSKIRLHEVALFTHLKDQACMRRFHDNGFRSGLGQGGCRDGEEKKYGT